MNFKFTKKKTWISALAAIGFAILIVVLTTGSEWYGRLFAGIIYAIAMFFLIYLVWSLSEGKKFHESMKIPPPKDWNKNEKSGWAKFIPNPKNWGKGIKSFQYGKAKEVGAKKVFKNKKK